MSDNIETDEEVQYASLGTRFGGQLIDNIFLAVLAVPIIVLPSELAGVYLMLWILFIIGYTLLIEGLWNGLTVGKYIVSERVVKDDGSNIGIGASLIRNLIGLVGSAFGWIGLLVGAFAIYQSTSNKRLGDSAAGTIVIKDRK